MTAPDPSPQTPEQVIAGVLRRRWDPIGGESFLSEIAAEVVAALGQHRTEYAAEFDAGVWLVTSDRAEAEENVQSIVGARLVQRDVIESDWRPAHAH